MKKEIVRNYFVDATGKVYNKQGKEKATFINRDGYEIVFLWEDNKAKSFTVHRLVALAFLDNPENKPCVNHIDGNKAHNDLSNLEWNTYSENTKHALRTGLKIPEQGEDVHNALLTNLQVHEICQMMENGYRNVEIHEMLEVSKVSLENIRRGIGWLSISQQYSIPRKSIVISEETIHWICKQIEAGVRNMEIVALSTNAKINKSMVTKIKNKKQYRHISDLYNF